MSGVASCYLDNHDRPRCQRTSDRIRVFFGKVPPGHSVTAPETPTVCTVCSTTGLSSQLHCFGHRTTCISLWVKSLCLSSCIPQHPASPQRFGRKKINESKSSKFERSMGKNAPQPLKRIWYMLPNHITSFAGIKLIDHVLLLLNCDAAALWDQSGVFSSLVHNH